MRGPHDVSAEDALFASHLNQLLSKSGQLRDDRKEEEDDCDQSEDD